ncbi:MULTISPECIES: hypothetical protein [unclassified Bradyrhizobium]|uniref:hypothetical protein n=1 Tax=unclassified Bradyrhizobium TaxID=2631580 RepID=UPI002916E886|nr:MULTISPECIES: hypothetical protein [unclassified Bradyrhizobium]
MKVVVYNAESGSRAAQHASRAELILVKIEQYAADPAAQANNVETLRARDDFRLCVGIYD